MQDFHLIRVDNALPFLLALEDAGAPVEALAEATGLPLTAVRQSPDGVIGEFALWQFIERGAEQSGRPLLGFEVAEAFPLRPDHTLGSLPLRLGKTLEHTLERFCEDVTRLSSGSYYSLDQRSGECWFRRVPALGGQANSWQAELYVSSMVLQIIRLHTAKDWLPPALRLSTSDKRKLPRQWAGLSVEWDCAATGILLPTEVLALPPRAGYTSNRRREGRPNRLTFRELVTTQLEAGKTGIEGASRQCGMSVSTLQRRLRASGTSYQQLLEETRLELARSLLQNTTQPLGEIAAQLGYGHLGNFSRAFSRMTGQSPSAYRRGS